MGGASRSTRRFDLDWLRFLSVLLLVPFHAALVFVRDPAYISYVKDPQESAVLKTAADLVYQFHMPLLFFIAGAGTWFGLGARGAAAFVRERTLRLLVPYCFSTAVLVPPMLYVQFLWKPGYVGRFRSFWEYYPQYFRVTGDLSGYAGTYTPGHLWFVLFLFCFSVAALPLLLLLRSPTAGRWFAGAAAFASTPGAVFLPCLPILLSMALPSIGGKNPAYYLILFLLGYAAMSHPSFREEIERRAPLALLVAILCAPALVGWLWPLGRRVAPFTWQSTGVGLVMSLSTWCWIVALAGFGSSHLKRGGRALDYLTRASYPFYILHLPILTVVAHAAVQVPAGVWTKFLGINLLTILATFLACELLVRRIRPARLLFGLKPAEGIG